MSGATRGEARPWVAYRRTAPTTRLRLFCLPHAGGGASTYARWARGLGPTIDVCPVQLPGREARLSEPPLRDMDAVVDALVEALDPHLDLPYALFGHSMGAAIAYELAVRLGAGRHGEPVRLMVSSRLVPGVPPRREPIHGLPNAAFKERLRRLSGTPDEVLECDELMDLLLPMLRADFELNDTYRPAPHPPLRCPVTAFGAVDDAQVFPEDLHGWGGTTGGAFTVTLFPGNHFYLLADPPAVIAAVAALLEDASSP